MNNRILLIGPGNSIHFIKWLNSTSKLFEEVYVLTQHEIKFSESLPKNVFVKQLPFKTKAGYLLNVIAVIKFLRKQSLSFIHVHYATGYGFLGAFLSNKKYNKILSFWGSDVYKFPKKSFFHKILLSFICKNYQIFISTSKDMKKEAFKNIIGMKNKVIKVIPFGVDTSIFKPVLVEKKNIFTVGIAKSLKPIYGIDILIKAIYLLKEKYSIKEILLFIAGSGPEEIKLKKLVDDLGIKENVRFLGELDPIDIPYFLNEIDLLCSPSHSESFGVVFLEALACETPVIGTNVGGIPEVIDHKKDGLMVKPNDYKELASAINYLISDPKRRQEYGKKGRVKVISKYSINAYDTYIRELYREGKHGELF